jgi:hypothetical protein
MAKCKLGHEPRPRWATAANNQKGNLEKSKRRRQLRGNWNEGVGEHVRTRFHLGALDPREIAELEEIRTERRKTCFFYRTGFGRANSFQKYDPAV